MTTTTHSHQTWTDKGGHVSWTQRDSRKAEFIVRVSGWNK